MMSDAEKVDNGGGGHGADLAAPGAGCHCAGAGAAGVCTALAQLPENALLDRAGLAGALGVHEKTVSRWVKSRTLPPGTRMGAGFRWTAGAVLTWIKRREQEAAEVAEREVHRLHRVGT
jgi:predicted DNA-binding transcriptional regulator AlpA